MSATNAERVQVAFDAAVAGDVEPLVTLMAPDLDWRGIGKGPPLVAGCAQLTCPKEAREVLQQRIPGSDVRPGLRIAEADAKVLTADEAGAVVALCWRFESSTEFNRRYQMLRMRDGLIVEMRDYEEERAARRALR